MLTFSDRQVYQLSVFSNFKAPAFDFSQKIADSQVTVAGETLSPKYNLIKVSDSSVHSSVASKIVWPDEKYSRVDGEIHRRAMPLLQFHFSRKVPPMSGEFRLI